MIFLFDEKNFLYQITLLPK